MSDVPQERGKPLGKKIQLGSHGLEVDFKAAWNQFIRGFSLAFACRSALSVLLRVLQLARGGKLKQIFNIENLFSEKSLIVRVEAVRLGLFVGQFSGCYELITRLLARYRGKMDGTNALVGGFVSGWSLLYLNAEDRRMASLYALARVAQCVYNILKNRGMWHFWGSDWNHGDTLLFALGTAQVMYAYVMRPTSIPASYYKFIQRTGPIEEIVLETVRTANRGVVVDTAPVLEYIKKTNPLGIVPDLSTIPPIFGCDVMHPMEPYCSKNFFRVLFSSFRKILPVYGSLTLISVVVVGFMRFIRSPLSSALHGATDTLRSSLFLASLVAIYQAVVCTHRKFAIVDHRFIYWVAGFLAAGSSIMIEKKSRRSELALYALPRALDSFYTILYDRKWLGSLPQGELLLFSLSCAGIMYCFDHESNAISPMIKWVLHTVFSKNCTDVNTKTQTKKDKKDKDEKEEKP